MSLSIHLVAIGGTGMAPLACLLQGLGHRVRGSDGPLYPPMSDLLASRGIEPFVGYDPANLEPRPDLVVVGNAVPRSNPEARAAEAAGIERISMPQALARFFLEDRRPLVVAGTHGKTTTSSLAAWVWTASGRDPGYLIGGIPHDLPASFHAGAGERFVVEGDEYNAAYFDRGPKFLHYRASTLLLTSVEYDHADLYPTPESLLDAYRELLRRLPADGLLVACGDDPEIPPLTGEAPCRTILYGLGEHNEVRPVGPIRFSPEGTSFQLRDSEGTREVELRLAGEHSVANALAVWAAARADGIDAVSVADALAGFRGVKRRLEEIGRPDGVLVIDDFAHHPTAVEKTLDGLRGRHPEARLVVAFEPRSLTAGRSFLFDAYVQALSRADRVLLAPVFHAERLGADERLDLPTLVGALAGRGVVASCHTDVDDLLARALSDAREGDVVVTMSSGSFEGLPRRVVAGLEERAARTPSSSG